MQLAPDHWTCHNLSAMMGGMDDDETSWQRLARHVTARRDKLPLTQAQVAAAGGPSVATMRIIEGGLQNNYRPGILARLETALQWEPGSVQAILGGGDPRPVTVERTPTVDLEAELRQIADNPCRSPRLRDWARAQLVEIAGIRAANEAEAVARGERQAC